MLGSYFWYLNKNYAELGLVMVLMLISVVFYPRCVIFGNIRHWVPKLHYNSIRKRLQIKNLKTRSLVRLTDGDFLGHRKIFKIKTACVSLLLKEILKKS